MSDFATPAFCGLTIAALVAAAVLLPGRLHAYETDQFSNRAEDVADSTEALNGKMNDTIREIVDEWDRGHDEWAFVNAIYRKVGGRHWVDRIERWAMRSPDVDKLDTPRYGSIYSHHPFWATRTIALFGIGKTIRLNDQLIGTDKLGHFISQGRKFYRRFRRLGSEDEAALHSAFTEKAIFGRMTTGNYSNADLVANYEGHRFYRSLFENGIVEGKPAILRWEDGGWVIQRDFDWADHVNEYWDEALNINSYDGLLYGRMHKRLLGLCPDYWKHPSLYSIVNEERLKQRYAHLGLKDNSELRLDSLCPVQVFLETGAIAAGKSSPDAQASP